VPPRTPRSKREAHRTSRAEVAPDARRASWADCRHVGPEVITDAHHRSKGEGSGHSTTGGCKLDSRAVMVSSLSFRR
jgi:hypothetical protein